MFKRIGRRLSPAWLRRNLRLLYYRGHRISCPYCGFTARRLVADGYDFPVLAERRVAGAGRRRHRCPRCNSGDRERLVLCYLRDELKLWERAGSLDVLHFAPEPRLSRRLLQAGLRSYVCGDLFTPGYRYASHVRDMNVLDIPYDDASFDVVICNHVLEHVPEDAAAMRELRRVMRPGAVAMLQVPISTNSPETLEDDTVVEDADRERVFGQYDHVRLYGADYVDRLIESGLAVELVDLTERYREHGVNPEEILYIASA